MQLRKYQEEFLKFYESRVGSNAKYRPGSLVLGDDMGLGKTIQSIAAAFQYNRLPCLIITLATIKQQWQREIEKWNDQYNIQILSGRKAHNLIKNTIYIINWEILQYWVAEIQAVPFKLIIADESAFACNLKAKRTIALMNIVESQKTAHFFALSGTPIKSQLDQFFPILNLIAPSEFPSLHKFHNMYMVKQIIHEWRYIAVQGKQVLKQIPVEKYTGIKNTNKLESILSGIFLRRKKEDVIDELPKKQRNFITIKNKNTILFNKEFYKKARTKHQLQAEYQKEIYRLFELKTPAIIDFIETSLISNTKLIVYCYNRRAIEYLYSKYKDKSVVFMGGYTHKNRELAKNDFITKDEKKILIAQYLAAGIGIDGLQNVCSTILFAQIGWVPSDIVQAEDRLYRLGQKNAVNVNYILVKSSLEENIVATLDRKQKIINLALEGREVLDNETFDRL